MDIDWRFPRRPGGEDSRIQRPVVEPRHGIIRCTCTGSGFSSSSRDGVRATNLVWKDTAIIPAGETVDLLVDMANPGRWMIHCHIAEHLGAGMMGVFTVDPLAVILSAAKDLAFW